MDPDLRVAEQEVAGLCPAARNLFLDGLHKAKLEVGSWYWHAPLTNTLAVVRLPRLQSRTDVCAAAGFSDSALSTVLTINWSNNKFSMHDDVYVRFREMNRIA